MAPTTIFDVPGSSLQADSVIEKKQRKRKRNNGRIHGTLQDKDVGVDSVTLASTLQTAEYTAVITPQERMQLRLAGLMPNQRPPASPFPHAAHRNPYTFTIDSDKSKSGTRLPSPSQTNLHAQHLAVMSAILHRSLMEGDYDRASRAFGLILRNDLGGRPIDIRGGGLWGVGAEILLHYQKNPTTTRSAGDTTARKISREGLERVKNYYENLTIQFPPHKTWPDAVNAKDFCIAMFGLWIFVINQEIIRLEDKSTNERNEDSVSQFPNLLESKLWELEQARSVAESMDVRMRDIVFRDDVEFMRLRAMVAIWEGDSLEQCSSLEEDENTRNDYEQELQDMEDLADNVERIALRSTQSPGIARLRTEEALASRKLAQSLFDKLSQQ